MTGNGGRFAPNNGHPEIPAAANSPHEGKQVPFLIIATTMGQYSAEVAGNATMIYLRHER